MSGEIAKRDPEVVAALDLLDQAARALVQADLAMAREIRARADAASVFARRKRADEVYRKAVEVRLKAEAHIGQEAGPALEGKAKTAAASAAKSTDDRVPRGNTVMEAAERSDLMRCRRVFAASSYLGAYLEHVKQAGEDPTRAGLLSFAAAQEKAKDEARAEADAREARRRSTEAAARDQAKTIDTTAVVKSGAMDDAKPTPAQKATVIPPPRGAPAPSPGPLVRRPAQAYVAQWRTFVRTCVDAIEKVTPPKGWFDEEQRAVLFALGELEERLEKVEAQEANRLKGGAA